MSLHLADSKEYVEAKSVDKPFDAGVNLYGADSQDRRFDVFISKEDFCVLVEYFMTNCDLTDRNDPRLALLRRLKSLRQVAGFNTHGNPKVKRLEYKQK